MRLGSYITFQYDDRVFYNTKIKDKKINRLFLLCLIISIYLFSCIGEENVEISPTENANGDNKGESIILSKF